MTVKFILPGFYNRQSSEENKGLILGLGVIKQLWTQRKKKMTGNALLRWPFSCQ